MTAIQILPEGLIYTIGWTLVHTVWQATLVAAVLSIVPRLGRRLCANARYPGSAQMIQATSTIESAKAQLIRLKAKAAQTAASQGLKPEP